MIVSVPHTGTRTLQEHLGESAFWHIHYSYADVIRYTGRVNVPIRDPFDVAMSWEARYGNEVEKDQPSLNKLWDMLINYVWQRPDTHFYVVEQLPVVKGRGPKHWAKDKKNRGKARKTERAQCLIRWMNESERRSDFFGRFYNDFWWL